jgi:hypothetical protein
MRDKVQGTSNPKCGARHWIACNRGKLTILRCEPPGLLTAYMWQPRVLSRRCSFKSWRPRAELSLLKSPSKSDSLNTWILLSRPEKICVHCHLRCIVVFTRLYLLQVYLLLWYDLFSGCGRRRQSPDTGCAWISSSIEFIIKWPSSLGDGSWLIEHYYSVWLHRMPVTHNTYSTIPEDWLCWSP